MTVYAENNGYVLVKAESSYGVDPTTAVPNNLLYVDEATIDAQDTVIRRQGMSPYASGFRPVAGPADVQVSITRELTLLTLSAGTERPPESPLLLACGFTVASSTPTNNVLLTYTARSFGATGSVTVEIKTHNQANDDGWEHQARGVRGDWTITLDPAARWTLSMAGMGSDYSHTRLNAARETAVDYTLPIPSVSGAATCVITRSNSGGVINTYPATGRVVSLTVTGNNGAQLQQGTCGQRVDFVPGDGPSGTLVVEVVDQDQFDPWNGIEEGDLIDITISSPAAQAGNTADGDYHVLTWRCYVETVAMGGDSGAQTWSLSLFNAYANDSSDGGGLKPADSFTFAYGTYTAP